MGYFPALLAVMLLTVPPASEAQTTTWQNASIGNWFIEGNWTAGVPASNTGAIIQNGGICLISSPGAQASNLFLGLNGQSGGLSISNGGTLAQTASVFLGRNANSTGTVTVNGPGSAWNAGSARVGGTVDPAAGGSGIIRIENGAAALASDVQLAWASAATGSVTVTGANSSWRTLALLDIGFRGSGALTIASGGSVTSDVGANLGGYAGATGTATVTGNGSSWMSGGPLYLGGRDNLAGASVNGGSGTLRIQSGGFVQAPHLKYFNNGVLEVDNGSITVTGLRIVGGGSAPPPGGTLGDMVVGTSTAGRMEIRGVGFAGGSVASQRGYIGISPGGNGAVLVTGTNSRWLCNGSVWVGNSGTGILAIRNSAYVSSAGNGYIGFSPGSVGDVTVSGVESVSPAWLMSANLYIGGNGAGPGGSGTLRFSNNGYVQAAAAIVYDTGVIELGPVGATPFFATPLTFLGGRIQTTDNIIFANDFTLGAGGVLVQTLGFNSTFSGVISGAGGLTKTFYLGTPAGTLELTGNNTYTGPTTIEGIGTLLVNGTIASATTVNSAGTLGGSGTVGAVTVNNGGTVAPGNSAGRLTINGSYNQTSGGKLMIELGGYTPGTEHDQLAVSGQAIAGGTLNVSLVNGFRPNVGDTFAIITSSSESGNFSTINSAGFTVRSDASATGIVLTVLSVDPSLRVTSIARSGNNIVIDFEGALIGRTYRLERKLLLSAAMWESPLTGANDFMAAENGSGQLTHSGGATEPKAFYRVRLLP